MIEQEIVLQNKLGLHARASMQVVNRACRYLSDISLQHADKTIDAKDILQVMSLGASSGTAIIIRASGEDEQEALVDMIQLFKDKFGEEE